MARENHMSAMTSKANKTFHISTFGGGRVSETGKSFLLATYSTIKYSRTELI